ncbi:putative transcriptional regulator [Gammaproteobacteria bacterium MOLA455]|nr:putative transcriptional regulator [Gammaproteobacteria bacterium MOLA455]
MKDINDIPRILRWKQVAQIIPWSKSYTYALINKGIFPKPQKLMAGGQAVGWLAADIHAYMRSLVKNMEQTINE